MRFIPALLLSVLMACLLACGDKQSPEDSNQQTQGDHKSTDDTHVSQQQDADASIALNTLYAEYDEAQLELNPLTGTFRGLPGYNDRWPNSIGNEHRAAQRQLHEHYLEQAQSLGEDAKQAGQLNDQAMLSYLIFIQEQQMALRAMDFPTYLMPINQFRNPVNFFAQLGSGQNAQPFNNEQDYRDFISRAEDFAVFIEQAIVNMQTGMQQGLTQPRALMERVLPQLNAHLVDAASESLFYRPLNNLPDDLTGESRSQLVRDYTQMINQSILPGIQRLHDFIKTEYIPAARDTAGMTHLPNGDAWYAFLVENTTSTSLAADAIHQTGLSEVARIHAEMREIMQAVNFTGTLQAFFEFTKEDTQFHFSSQDEMLTSYRALRDTVDTAAATLFASRPVADFEIRAVEPYREQSASSASYQAPAVDGSRPGIFYLNTYDLPARPTWAMTSLYLHEAVPGHHFQIASQQELDDLPAFRKFGGTTAYVEGWGLYAESLGTELGVFDDPYQHYGALAAELWRAIRLVVDTGLHLKGWSRQDVLDYMYANAPVKEARAVSEAERFMAIPSQALAYKVGQLKIRELRNTAEQTLGDRFDVKAFHAQVLDSGSLPLSILEDKINRWIESQDH